MPIAMPARPLHAARTAAIPRGADGGPIRSSEVEPAARIVKRFCTGAMSFGSISAEAARDARPSP